MIIIIAVLLFIIAVAVAPGIMWTLIKLAFWLAVIVVVLGGITAIVAINT